MADQSLSEQALQRLIALQKKLEDYAAKAEIVDAEVKRIEIRMAAPRTDLPALRKQKKALIDPFAKQTDELIAAINAELTWVREEIPAELHARAVQAKGGPLAAEEQRELDDLLSRAVQKLESYYRSIVMALSATRKALERQFVPAIALLEFKNTFVIGVKFFPQWVELEKVSLLVPLREAEGYVTMLRPA